MDGFDRILNIDFYDVLNAAGQGQAPGIEGHDHYPAALLEDLIVKAAAAGYAAVNMRVDYIGWVGINDSPGRDKPLHHPLFMATLKAYDPLRVAIDTAHKHGIDCYAWLTPLDNCGRTMSDDQRNNFQSTFSFENREYHLCSRNGLDHIAILCFGYEAVQAYMLDHVKHVIAYRPDGLFFSDRTHANSGVVESKLEYGFNAPVVEAYQQRYGDDPRDRDAYDLAKFSEVQGSFYTDFLRAAAAMIHDAGLTCLAKASWRHDGRISHRLGGLDRGFFQWPLWVDEGMVDTLVVGGDAATSLESPEHILGYFDVTTKSVNQDWLHKQTQRRVPLYRWVTLWDWGWPPESDALTEPPSRSFTGEWAARMLRLVQDAGMAGALVHEAVPVQVHGLWDVG